MTGSPKLRGFIKYPLTLIGGALAGLLLLWLVFLLPDGNIQKNVERSIPAWENEGAYPQLIEGVPVTQLDNYTDTWAVDLAGNTRGDGLYTPLQRACNPHFALSELPEDERWGVASGYFNYLKYPQEPSYISFYGLYWCATVIPVRLGLMLFTYQQLRIINLALQCLLIAAVLIAVWKAYGLRYTLPILIFLGAMYMPAVWRSFQQSSCFYLAMGGCLYYAVRHIRGRRQALPTMSFMVLGMLSSYFPFLTYPMIILALPLMYYIAGDGKGTLWDRVKTIVLLSLMWGIGFAVMWGSKWLICLLSGNADMAAAAFTKMDAYSTIQQESRLAVLLKNLQAYPKKWIAAFLIPTAGLGAAGLVRHRRQLGQYFSAMLPYGLVMLIPLVWMLLTPSHASLHFWFTCRNYAVVFSGLCLMALARFTASGAAASGSKPHSP